MKKKKKSYSKRGIGLQVITLCISTSLVLILLGMVVFTGLTAHNLSNYVKENLTVTVMFEDNVSSQQAKVVCNKLRKQHYVLRLDFISKEQALKEQTQALGANPAEFLGENPFTASAEIYLKADCANADSLKWIAKRIKSNKQVAEVTYQQDLMDNVNKSLSKIMLVLIVLAGLLTFVSFSLINNSVRLMVFARRFIINTMKLVGASWSFIRKPFIKMGVVQGMVAGIVADAALAGCVFALYNFEPDILEVVTWETLTITGVSVLLFGIIISTGCVYVSVNRYLKMKTKDLYKM
ncbi:MAG: permease-like cell division protein FtsX [Prevotella sp.]|nr:permease-like cell division protein FtsX [Prevotella sp.]